LWNKGRFFARLTKKEMAMNIYRDAFKRGRIVARPGETISGEEHKFGAHPLDIDRKRDALIYLPKTYIENKPSPLAVMLHGAGGDAYHGMSLLRHLADDNNLILLAPVSRHTSWDIISMRNFGVDVAFINRALEVTFERFNVDASRLAVGGFSDGASYALSIGLINGDLFTHIMAFSPGFFYSPETFGKPAIFISHGVNDNVLPINACSRKIVSKLAHDRDVVYNEFDGEHVIPEHISDAATRWFLNHDK
jgi:phospholipase/carboxylesterase